MADTADTFSTGVMAWTMRTVLGTTTMAAADTQVSIPALEGMEPLHIQEVLTIVHSGRL
jgi:hypothetical protein